jgi:hypothetical protein
LGSRSSASDRADAGLLKNIQAGALSLMSIPVKDLMNLSRSSQKPRPRSSVMDWRLLCQFHISSAMEGTT